MRLRHFFLGLLVVSPVAACGIGYSQAEHDPPQGVHPIGTTQPTPVPTTTASAPPSSTGAPGPTGTPSTPPFPPPDAIWVSHDGPILGVAASTDRVAVVTAGKVVSFRRDGTDVRPLATSGESFAYGGAIAVDEGVTYFGTNGGVSSVPTDGSSAPVSLGSEGYATTGIAFDYTNVYWLTNDAVNSVPRQGGVTTTLAHVRGLTYGNAFTFASGRIYWSTNGSALGNDVAELVSIDPSGGPPALVRPYNVYSLVPNGIGGVAWIEEPAGTLLNARAGSPSVVLPSSVSEATTNEVGSSWYFRDDLTGALDVLPPEGPVATAVPATPKAGNAFTTANMGFGPHIIAKNGQVLWADRTIAYDSNTDINVLRSLRPN